MVSSNVPQDDHGMKSRFLSTSPAVLAAGVVEVHCLRSCMLPFSTGTVKTPSGIFTRNGKEEGCLAHKTSSKTVSQIKVGQGVGK